MQNKVGGKIGDAVLENAKKSTEGLSSFIGQLEQMPVFGAISGIGNTRWFCSQCSHGKTQTCKRRCSHSETTWYH